jgi:hypothetical protein
MATLLVTHSGFTARPLVVVVVDLVFPPPFTRTTCVTRDDEYASANVPPFATTRSFRPDHGGFATPST